MAAAETTAAETERRAKAGSLPADAQDSVENRAAVEGWRDRLAGLRAKAETAEDAARHAEARAASTEGVAAQAAPAPGATAARRPCRSRFRLAAIGVGVVFVGGRRRCMGQPLASVLGAIVLLAGVVALAMTIARKPAAAPAEALAVG